MGRRLRVMFVVPDLIVGGAERHAVTLLSSLDPTRFVPSMICIGQRGALFDELADAGVPARALLRTKRDAARAFVDLVIEMRRFRPDIVVVRGYNAEVLGRVAAAVCRVPHSVVWMHNCGDLTSRGRLRRWADRVLEPVTSAYYGLTTGQLPYLTDDLGYPPSKIRVIHNGVDLARFEFVPGPARESPAAAELGIGPEHAVVGIVAQLRPEKDHAMFLAAARLVVDAVPHARFLIVGDGEERADLAERAERLGIAEHVIFTGVRHDVSDLLELTDVFVLSSYTIECFPMALLEAMAIGRPAVCTAVGGVPEMIADGVTGYVTPPRDARALAEALVRLLRDRVLAREMGLAARARVEAEFTLERSIRAAERAFEETAGITQALR